MLQRQPLNQPRPIDPVQQKLFYVLSQVSDYLVVVVVVV